MKRIYSAGRSTNGLSRKAKVLDCSHLIEGRVYIFVHHRAKTENAIQIVKVEPRIVTYKFYDTATQSCIEKLMYLEVWRYHTLAPPEMEIYATV